MAIFLLLLFLTIIYFGLVKLTSIDDVLPNDDSSIYVRNSINNMLDGNRDFEECLEVTIAPVGFSMDDADQFLGSNYLMTVKAKLCGLVRDYSIVIPSNSEQDIEKGIKAIVMLIFDDIQRLVEITC